MDTSYVRLLSANQRLAEWWQEVKENYQDEFWNDTDRFRNRFKQNKLRASGGKFRVAA